MPTTMSDDVRDLLLAAPVGHTIQMRVPLAWESLPWWDPEARRILGGWIAITATPELKTELAIEANCKLFPSARARRNSQAILDSRGKRQHKRNLRINLLY